MDHGRELPQSGPLLPWDADPAFTAIWAACAGVIVIDRQRAHMLRQLAALTADVPGHMAEVGVYRGGSAYVLGESARRLGVGKRLYLFDTFAGMPAADTSSDWHREGDYDGTGIDAVATLMSGIPGVEIIPGIFPASAAAHADAASQVYSLVHVDCDLYRSVLDSLDFFWSRMAQGGVIVLDDWGCPTCPGATRAMDEFFSVPGRPVLRLATGQCLAFKPGAPAGP